MKFLLPFIILLLCSILSSCDDAGTTTQHTTGQEEKLPPELKGLKIYSVSTGDGYVKVAVMGDQVNSVNYTQSSGKFMTHYSTIMLSLDSTIAVIRVKEVLLENDSIIVCRKW